MSENELNALADALRGLKPSAQPLDRDALLYQAGLAAGRRGQLLWSLAAAASALLAVGLGVVLWARPREVSVVERVVYRPAPKPAPAPLDEPPPETPVPGPYSAPAPTPWERPATEYDRVCDQVLRWGLDGLPPAPRTGNEPVTAADVLRPF